MYKYIHIDKVCHCKLLTKEVKKAENWFIKQKYISDGFVDYEDKCLYVLDGDKIIATVVYTYYRTYTHISLIFINKFYRGQGLLKELLKNINGKRFQWNASIHNLDAVVAYAKLGALIKKNKYKPEMVHCVFVPKSK